MDQKSSTLNQLTTIFNLTLVMLRYAMYVTVNIIFINVDKQSFDIGCIITLVWPPKGLRNLDRILRFATHLSGYILKFSQVSSYMLDGLYCRLL